VLLAAEGVDAQPRFVVRELDAVQGLAQLFVQCRSSAGAPTSGITTW